MNQLYAGIDIGGTHIRGVLFDRDRAKVVRRFIVDTPHRKGLVLKILTDAVTALIAGYQVNGIGVGVPGAIEQGRILRKASNLGFMDGWNVHAFFKKFHPRVAVDNDSRCFLRAEASLGAGRGLKNIVALTIGTGIGGGIMMSGTIYTGSHGAAGEFGHMILDRNKSFEALGAKKAFERSGDRSAVVGIGVANIVNAFDPDIVILGGGGITSGGVKLAAVRRAAQKHIMAPAAKRVPITRGALGDLAQAIGASLLI